MIAKLAASALIVTTAALGLGACSQGANGDSMKDPASTNQQMKDSGSGDAMKDGEKMTDGDAMKDGAMKDGEKMGDHDHAMSDGMKDSMKK